MHVLYARLGLAAPTRERQRESRDSDRALLGGSWELRTMSSWSYCPA